MNKHFLKLLLFIIFLSVDKTLSFFFHLFFPFFFYSNIPKTSQKHPKTKNVQKNPKTTPQKHQKTSNKNLFPIFIPPTRFCFFFFFFCFFSFLQTKRRKKKCCLFRDTWPDKGPPLLECFLLPPKWLLTIRFIYINIYIRIIIFYRIILDHYLYVF